VFYLIFFVNCLYNEKEKRITEKKKVKNRTTVYKRGKKKKEY